MNPKRIFITGGASGLGKSIALCYARHGWRVCIGDINPDVGNETLNELKEIQPDAMYRQCDVRKIEDVENIRKTLDAEWGGVDVVVNNAGVAGTARAIEEVPMEDWEWVIDINLKGVIQVSKAFIPQLKAQKSGHIVNIASAAGLMNAPRMGNYNMTKAGVISLSETSRIELAMFDVGVSVVCPGFFPTKLADTIRSDTSSTQAWIEKAMAHSGVTAEDVANMIFSAVEKNQFWVLPHKAERRLWLLKRWMPELFFKQMRKRTRNLFNK